jgi:hypothetical protein
MAKVTNVNNGGTVGIQTGDKGKSKKDDRDDVVNVNNGGTVGIQCGNVTGSVIVVR